MNKIITVIIFVFFLLGISYFILNKKDTNSNEYNQEIQGLIKNQLEKGPDYILKLDCDADFTMKESKKYCIEEQNRVKKIFNL